MGLWSRERAPQFDLRLGLRGYIGRGTRKASWVVIDSVGMTPVDPLVVVVSPDLDCPGHPDEVHFWSIPRTCRGGSGLGRSPGPINRRTRPARGFNSRVRSSTDPGASDVTNVMKWYT